MATMTNKASAFYDTAINAVQSESHQLSGVQKLWGAALVVKTQDAIFPFTIPDGKPQNTIEEQYERFRDGTVQKPDFVATSQETYTQRAMVFFESSHFEETLEFLNRENQVSEIFSFIQECVTLRNRLYKDVRDQWENQKKLNHQAKLDKFFNRVQTTN